jgi:hypothetical protein
MTFMRLSVGRVFAVLAALTLLTGCAFPTHNQSTLKAIKAESKVLMATHSIKSPKGWTEIPKNRLPPVIAGLQPYSVIINQGSVDILIRPDFDGGWGYEVPRNKRGLSMPIECYSEPSEGVFWHSPC